jgi:hypothetical protein
MPQYDSDSGILEERAYAMAQEVALTEWDPELSTPSDACVLREDIRTLLLAEFPDIEGPRLAELMDEALHYIPGFPLEEM